MAKWTVVVRDVKGKALLRDPYRLRRNALRAANRLRSPLYDVTLERHSETSEVLYPHMDPADLVDRQRRMAGGDSG